MLMNKFLHTALACLLLSATLVGCHTSKRTAAASTTHKPEFLDDVVMDKHTKRNVSTETVASHHKKSKTKNTKEVIVSTDKNTAGEDFNPLKVKYAALMGVTPQDIINPLIYQFIEEWYGVRYHLGGNDKSGIDCSAFVQRFYSTVYGMDLVRTAVEQFNNCEYIRRVSKATEGDLVFFHIHSKHITHVGIYLMNDYFVHASSTQGVVISNLNDDYWQKYFAGAGRIPRGNM